MKNSFILLIFIFCLRVCDSQTSSYNALYLDSYSVGYSWSDSITKGVTTALQNQNINLYIESLDAKRFGQQKFDIFYNFLKDKFIGIKFDIIITSDNDALDFIQLYEKQLFNNIPVVFCGIANPEDYKIEGSNKYGIIESDNPDEFIPVLIRLLPKTKSLLFINDNSTSGLIKQKKIELAQRLYPTFNIKCDKKSMILLLNVHSMNDLAYYAVNSFLTGHAFVVTQLYEAPATT